MRNPGFFAAAGAYSGCPITSGERRWQVADLVMFEGGNADNMWGPGDSEDWIAHDPSKNLDKLRGKPFYIAAANGQVGEVDKLPSGGGVPIGAPIIEQLAAQCTQEFVDDARTAGLKPTYVQRDEGGHTWGLFESEMEESWNKVIAPALRTR
jgi:S-formylglutathione hydrolase FrmB